MNLLKHIFKPNAGRLKKKNQKRIYKFLYEFSESSEISNLLFCDKTFRTKTFWENTTLIIPTLFQNWLIDKGIKVLEENDNYQALNNTFGWKMTTYRFDEFDNYYIGYQFRLNPNSEIKNESYKYEIHHLIIEIEKGYPKAMKKVYFNHTSQEIEGLLLVKKISLENLDENLIHKKLKENLECFQNMELDQYVMRTSLAKNNPSITDVRREVEIHFREVAEKYLKELADKKVPVIGVPFKDKLEIEAAWLSKTLYDDYDLYVNYLERRDLEKTIQEVKNKIITQYRNS